jgi:prepilin-type processing-associated H-X9-DG protein
MCDDLEVRAANSVINVAMQDDLPPTPLGYTSRKARRPGWLRVTCMTALLIGVAFLVWSAITNLQSMQVHDDNFRPRCATNLREMGLAIIMYANQHGGNFPDDLQALYSDQDLASDTLFCPTTPPPLQSNATTQQAIAAINAGRSSYIYVGKGLTVHSPDDVVVMYEPLSDHTVGINVLFADAHVEWLELAEAKKLLARFAAGEEQVRYPPTSNPATQR